VFKLILFIQSIDAAFWEYIATSQGNATETPGFAFNTAITHLWQFFRLLDTAVTALLIKPERTLE
jgi:hypothetical protein